MDERERLSGIARTLTILADGLVRSGFIDPGELSTASSVMEELKQDVEDADLGNSVNVDRLPLLVLQIVRIAELSGVRPSEPSIGETSVVEAMDVMGGLELLGQLPTNIATEIRGVATAISVLVDYAFIVTSEAIRGSDENLDVVSLTRGVLAVAEVSVRKALEPKVRAEVAKEILRTCADQIEEDIKANDEEKGA